MRLPLGQPSGWLSYHVAGLRRELNTTDVSRREDVAGVAFTALSCAGCDRRKARVAGPAPLLVAKAYKIRDRVEKPGKSRLNDKDAGDVVRLMMIDEGPPEVAKHRPVRH